MPIEPQQAPHGEALPADEVTRRAGTDMNGSSYPRSLDIAPGLTILGARGGHRNPGNVAPNHATQVEPYGDGDGGLANTPGLPRAVGISFLAANPGFAAVAGQAAGQQAAAAAALAAANAAALAAAQQAAQAAARAAGEVHVTVTPPGPHISEISMVVTDGGGPLTAGTITLVIAAVGNVAIVGLAPVPIVPNDTVTTIAAKIATELNGKQDATGTVTLTATSIAGVVTVADQQGDPLTTATATVVQQAVVVATPIAVNVTGGGTNGMALEVTGGPQAGAGTVTVAGLAVDGTPIVVGGAIAIADTDTAAQVATKIAAALTGKQDAGTTITITATVAADNVTVNLTNAGGGGAGNFDNGATATVA